MVLPAKLGDVTFDHRKHASELKIDCATCHHPSRAERPHAAQQQACRDCHTQPAAAPVTTSLRDAFHNATAKAGLCVDCHLDPKNQGRATPAKCADCHRKAPA
ncbi:MAG TPA: cytochrome c3 family protein [Thermoanaerobaculia bacterium]|nr:cytochrome c3 family protein [Thermoanaerobaculia bacterium]